MGQYTSGCRSLFGLLRHTSVVFAAKILLLAQNSFLSPRCESVIRMLNIRRRNCLNLSVIALVAGTYLDLVLLELRVKVLIRKLCILLVLLPVFGLLICVSTSEEQVVTATARITLSVIPPPGIVFTSTDYNAGMSLRSQAGGGAMILHASSNVAVILNFFDRKRMSDPIHSSQELTKTLSFKELPRVSKVDVIYLGN